MKIIAYSNDSGSRSWRYLWPFYELNKMGHECEVINSQITDEPVQWADIISLKGIVDKKGLALLRAYQMEQGKKIVMDIDDWVKPNPDSPHKLEHDMSNAEEVQKITMGFADLITTTNSYLAKKIKKYNKNVVVVPNYIPLRIFDLKKFENDTDEIRIGWAGGVTHVKDLEMIQKPLTRIAKEFPQVKLVFVGDVRVGKLFKGLNVETTVGTPITAWPSKLHSLRLDIGLAPLQDNEFNKCKSNIKWQEYSVAKIPGVYSNTVYQVRGFEPTYGLIAYNEKQWYQTIKNLVKSETLRDDIAKSAYSRVTTNYSLEKNADEWEDAYKALT